MITKEKYIILDEIPLNKILSVKLCVINFNIAICKNEIRNLVASNPNVVFWVASNDFSKEYIQMVSELGISNVIQIPINTEIIEQFFSCSKKNDNELFSFEYEKLSNSKILIVDDNDMNLKLLNEILFDLGAEIKLCKNPLSALELVKNEKFSLFLLDILMPSLSGFELAEFIKKSQMNSNTPIVFVSAVSGTENILNGYNLGAYSYIEKPFNLNIVKSQIYNILKNEELKLKQDKEKEHFVATLTHDLKSPINAEISALNILLNISKNNSEKYNELLTDMLSSAKYMKLITDKILTHYKQQSNSFTLNKENIFFSNLIESSIEELKYLANEKNIKIIFKSNTEKDYVFVDLIEMKRVLNNLLSNSIEYSRQNGIINVTLDGNDEKLFCTIKDYGIGIEINDVDKVFDDYISFSKSQKKIGFGLGLNICKKIINAHNGEITIESQQNKGTTVQFYIPINE